MKNRCLAFLGSPWFHGARLVMWMLLAIPSYLWWQDSVAWVMWMSLYAIIITEASTVLASVAARSAERAEKAATK